MTEPEKNDDSGMSIEGKLRFRGGRSLLKSISDRVNWTFVAVVLIGGPGSVSSVVNMWTGAETKQAVDATQAKVDAAKLSVNAVKDIAENETLPAAKAIQHEFNNGFADKLGANLEKRLAPKLDAMDQRIKAIEEYLTGADDKGANKPNATTARRDAG